MDVEDIVEVETPAVRCDGNGPLGHPAVYLTFGEKDAVVCPYCSRTFVLKKGAARVTGH